MKYGLVDILKRKFSIVEAETPPLEMAGLHHGQVDHGIVALGIAIIVYEFGLFERPESQLYFAIGRHLFAGSAVLYAINERGETVDFTGLPGDLSMRWLLNRDAIEREISAGLLDRPAIRVNGQITWQWPERRSFAR